MSKFNFMSFTTIYKTQYCGNEFNFLHDRACFGDTFRSQLFRSSTPAVNLAYEIYVCLDEEGMDKGCSNYCMLTHDDILAYIHQLQELQPFFCSVEFDAKFPNSFKKYNWKSMMKLNVSIDANFMRHKFVLTALRYLWEYPFNIELYEAMRLRKEFPQLNILMLHHLVMGTFDAGERIHQLGYVGKIPMKLDHDILQAALEIRDGVNDIYDGNYTDTDDVASFEYIIRDNWKDTDLLFDKQKQEERDQIYKKNIQLIWEISPL